MAGRVARAGPTTLYFTASRASAYTLLPNVFTVVAIWQRGRFGSNNTRRSKSTRTDTAGMSQGCKISKKCSFFVLARYFWIALHVPLPPPSLTFVLLFLCNVGPQVSWVLLLYSTSRNVYSKYYFILDKSNGKLKFDFRRTDESVKYGDWEINRKRLARDTSPTLSLKPAVNIMPRRLGVTGIDTHIPYINNL